MKYPISKELFTFSHFTPPISERFLAMAVPHMKAPKYIFKDSELKVGRHEIESYDGEHIECLLMSPRSLGYNTPCLIYLHGGGFVLVADLGLNRIIWIPIYRRKSILNQKGVNRTLRLTPDFFT